MLSASLHSGLFNPESISQLSYKLQSGLQENIEGFSFIRPPDVTLMLFLHLTSFISLLEHESCRTYNESSLNLPVPKIEVHLQNNSQKIRMEKKNSSFIVDVLIYSVPLV